MAKVEPRKYRVAVLELFMTAMSKAKHPGAENVKQALLSSDSEGLLDVRLFSVANLLRGGLKTFNVLVVPGGSSGQQAMELGPEGRGLIAEWVRDGNGYVGICAGAFLALEGYCPKRSIGLLRASALSDWERGHHRTLMSLTEAGAKLLNAPALSNCTVRYNNGPCIIPYPEEEKPAGESKSEEPKEESKDEGPKRVTEVPTILATFASGVTPSDEESVGCGAAACGNYGLGRVFVFSAHLESTPKDKDSLSKTSAPNADLQACVRRAVLWTCSALDDDPN